MVTLTGLADSVELQHEALLRLSELIKRTFSRSTTLWFGRHVLRDARLVGDGDVAHGLCSVYVVWVDTEHPSGIHLDFIWCVCVRYRWLTAGSGITSLVGDSGFLSVGPIVHTTERLIDPAHHHMEEGVHTQQVS